MTVGLTIPGVETLHPREAWEEVGYRSITDFIDQPPPLKIANYDRGAIHYTAAVNLPDGDPNEILNGLDGIRKLLAAAQRDYYNNRTSGDGYRRKDGRVFPGFPLGYSFAVDWLGGVWEIRGFDFQPAATGGHNNHAYPILMLTDLSDPGTDLMWESARAVLREVNRRGGHLANEPWAHGWFLEETGVGTATACCGVALKAQITAGLGNLDYDEPEPEPPIPPTPGDEMEYLYRPYGYANVFHIANGYPEVLDRARLDYLRAAGLHYFDGAKNYVNGKPVNRPHQPTVDWLLFVTGLSALTSLPSEPLT